MAVYIATWDGTGEQWSSYEADAAAWKPGRHVDHDDWSVNDSHVVEGDVIFLLRQRLDRGIVAKGYATGSVFKARHWNPSTSSRRALYVGIEWVVLLPLARRLTIEDLVDQVPGHKWNNIYASGRPVHSPMDGQLERLWARHLDSIGIQEESR